MHRLSTIGATPALNLWHAILIRLHSILLQCYYCTTSAALTTNTTTTTTADATTNTATTTTTDNACY